MNRKIFRGMLFAVITTVSLCLLGCDPKDAGIQQGPKVTDAEGNDYPSVKIGNQIWMAKNLNVNVPGSMCYENKPKNCKKYGRLYTWEVAKKVCPAGWHLPSKDEFEMLLATVGASDEDRSKNLRAGSWDNGKDEYGFSALPAGHYISFSQKFYGLGDEVVFWSSTEGNSDHAYFLDFSYLIAFVGDGGKNHGHPVRCLQDYTADDMTDPRDGQTYKTVKIGHQIWMAENLNYKTSSSICFENDDENCEKFGRKYNKSEAEEVCPDGWRLPSIAEYRMAARAFGGKPDVDNKNNWFGLGGFVNAMLGKIKMPQNFCNIGGHDPNVSDSDACFWASRDVVPDDGYDTFFGKAKMIVIFSDHYKNNEFSVRCVRK